MTVALYLYGAIRVGLCTADLNEMTVGMVLDLIDVYNDIYSDTVTEAGQADFDNF